MALARRLLRPRPHLGTFLFPAPTPPRPLPSRTYISDMRRSAFVDRLLRGLRSETSFLADSTPPAPPAPPARFSLDERPGERWIRLSSAFPAAEGGGEEEDVRVDATLVDGALPPTCSGADTGGPPRLHISVRVEVSKTARPGVVLTFMCSAWPDEMEVERVFPVCSGGQAPVQQYVGRQFSELDEEMQNAVRDYLERRGVDDDLAAFLHSYMENKEHSELVRWMKNVECYNNNNNNNQAFYSQASWGRLEMKPHACGFISIEMAKIVVGSPSLTQLLLLYPGLGPAMLDNIGGVEECRVLHQKMKI